MGLGNKIREQVAQYDPISLEQMDKVRLMRRTDTKFVFNKKYLPSILEQARENYFMVEIKEEREQIYETIYFDTNDYEMYNLHHNGRSTRYKVRIRKYVYSDQKFLEVKTKNNKGETIKNRISFKEDEDQLVANYTKDFLLKHTPFDQSNLIPKLGNKFIRLTLVNKNMTERITLDYKLKFEDLTHKSKTKNSDICVAEIKRDKDNKHSKFVDLLKENRLKPLGFSKYCIGMAILNPIVKTNLFKKRIRAIVKI